MPKIAIVSTTAKIYGRGAYESILREELNKKFDLEPILVGARGKGKLRYLEAPFVLWRLFKVSRRKDLDIVIRDFEGSLFLSSPPTKNVLLIHHIDSSHSPLLLRIFYLILKKLISRNFKRADVLVVVSKYWRRYFRKLGYGNAHLIHNAFDLSKFDFDDREITDFKERYGLTKKPLVYLGNAQKKKGVVESFNALKDTDFSLVTSSNPALAKTKLEIPVPNLSLKHEDYIRLLKASSVVITMSKFKEGWCRTAHEAMLCGTSVVGSGEGGMEELLEGGGQMICKSFEDLEDKVNFAIKHQELGEKGYQFAKAFTIDKFRKSWIDLINGL